MLSFNLKVLFRHSLKSKFLYFFILISLSVSFAIISIVFQYIINEYKFNSTICESSRVCKLIRVNKTGIKSGFASFQKGKEAKELFPEIDKIVTYRKIKNAFYDKIHLKDFAFTNQDFFKVFNLRILSGNKNTLLTEPNSIVLSQSKAMILFGNTDIIGNEFSLNLSGNKYLLTVTGVFEDVQKNNTIIPGYLASIDVDIDYLKRTGLGTFADSYDALNEIYFLLNKENDYAHLKNKIIEIKPEYESIAKYDLQPFKEIYFNPTGVSDLNKHSNMKHIRIIIILGITMFFVSILNFIIMLNAHRLKKMREIGLKKVFGAKNSNLTYESIFESFVFVLVSILCGLVLTEFIKPILENVLNTEIIIKNYVGTFFLSMLILIIISSVVLGLTQRILLKKRSLTEVIHSSTPSLNSRSTIQPIPIIQSTILFTLIITISLIFIQLDYLLKYDLGFKSKKIVCVDNYYFSDKMDAFKTNAYKFPFIEKISSCEYLFPSESDYYTTVDCFLDQNANVETSASYLPVDFGMLELLNLELVKGKTFEDIPQSEAINSVIINESTAQKLNLKSPLNHYISYEYEDSLYTCKVVGVVKNFHFTTLHSNIEPLILKIDEDFYDAYYTYISFKDKITKQKLEKINNILAPFLPDQTREDLIILEDHIKKSYQKEVQIRNIFSFISILIFTILYLGLFSLSYIYVNQNFKKFAILSVYGGTYKNLLVFSIKRYYFQLFIGIFLAIPTSYVLFKLWQQNFYIKYQPGFVIISIILIFSALLAFVPTLLSIHKIKQSNLIESLRNEN